MGPRSGDDHDLCGGVDRPTHLTPKEITEPVALSSTSPTNVRLRLAAPPTVPRSGFGLLALRARCVRDAIRFWASVNPLSRKLRPIQAEAVGRRCRAHGETFAPVSKRAQPLRRLERRSDAARSREGVRALRSPLARNRPRRSPEAEDPEGRPDLRADHRGNRAGDIVAEELVARDNC